MGHSDGVAFPLLSFSNVMINSYLQAFRRAYTYDLRRNGYLWLGVLWGLPVPAFSLFLDATLTGADWRNPLAIVRDHPIHILFLLHPFFFGLLFGAMGSVRHVLEEENRRLIDRLTEMAMTDPLTGIYNRRYVLEELGNLLHRAWRSGEDLMVVLFDLDKFKAINEERGHPVGDAVLRKAAEALKSGIRQGDILGRYGGDEFILVVPGDARGAFEAAERASRAVQMDVGLTASFGAARLRADGLTAEDLIRAADLRLAQVKRKKRETERVLR